MRTVDAGKKPLTGRTINRFDFALGFDSMSSKEWFDPLIHGRLPNIVRLEPRTFIGLLVKTERGHFWVPLSESLIR